MKSSKLNQSHIVIASYKFCVIQNISNDIKSMFKKSNVTLCSNFIAVRLIKLESGCGNFALSRHHKLYHQSKVLMFPYVVVVVVGRPRVVVLLHFCEVARDKASY